MLHWAKARLSRSVISAFVAIAGLSGFAIHLTASAEEVAPATKQTEQQKAPKAQPKTQTLELPPVRVDPAKRSAKKQARKAAPKRVAAPVDPIIVEAEKVLREYFRTYTSVGIVTAQDISDYNVLDLRRSFEMIANVRSFSATRGNDGFVIRGINSEGLSQPTRSAPLVSVVIDGAIQNTEATRRGARGLWDVEQLEVLRGPQSTLQGRHSLGGAVLIRTKDPVHRAEVILEGQAGTHDFKTGAFAVNLPLLQDQMAVRVSGQGMRETKDITYTDPLVASLGRDEFEQVRGKLLLTPKDMPGLRALFTVSHTFDKPAVTAVTGPNFFARRFDVTASSGAVDFRQTRTNNYISDISYEFAPGWSVRSLTAFAETNTSIGSPEGSSIVRSDQRAGGDFSQDLRVVFESPHSPLTGVVGLFAGRFANDTNSLITTTQLAGFGIPTANLQQLQSNNETTSFAAYADLRYRFVDRWTLIAGGRLLRDRVANDIRGQALDFPATEASVIGCLFFLICPPTAVQASIDESVASAETVFLPKVGIAYDLAVNQTIAATATKGYRSGFAEAVIGTTTINRVAPESLWSYELAYRSKWLQDSLLINANVFYYDYRNQQLVIDNPAIVGTSTTANIAKSHAYGAEVEMRWRVIEGLQIFSSVGLLKTEFDEAVTILGTFNGNQFPSSPTVTGSAGGIYKHASGFFAGMDMSYTHGFYSSGDLANTRTRWVDGFTVVNGRIGYETKHGSLTVFARNLFNEQYLTSISANATEATIGDSRLIGVKGTARF